jgi:hypothetical protein
MSLGFFSAQSGHWVPLIGPVDETGGKTSHAFSMAMWAHASIAIMIGVSAAAPGAITLNACTDAAGDNPTAIPFNVFKCEVANSDVLGPKVAVTSAGFTPPATDNIFYVIEIDAQQLPQGSPYLQLAEADATNSVINAAIALLSGGRQISDQSATVLT